MSTARKLQAHRPKNAGFSLIELLVVTAIIIMLVGISIAGFIRFNERQQVESAAKQVQTLFRTAQAKAQIREIPTGTCDTLDGYMVRFQTSPTNSVELVVQCTNGVPPEGLVQDHLSISAYTVPDGIVITRDPEFESVLFRPLRGGARIHNSSGAGAELDSTEVSVANSTGSPNYVFTIYNSGLISEGGFE